MTQMTALDGFLLTICFEHFNEVPEIWEVWEGRDLIEQMLFLSFQAGSLAPTRAA